MLLIVSVLLSLACSALGQGCTARYCRNSGVCVVVGGSPACACPSGWRGKQCEIADGLGQQACNTNPCQNNGVCQPLGDRFKCDCLDGFFGVLCQQAVVAQPTQPTCKAGNFTNVACIKADIIFMIEYSDRDDFFDIDHEGDFIKDAIADWDIASGRTRVGVVAYHDTVYDAIHLDDYEKDAAGLSNAITRLTRSLSPSGSNDLGHALDYVKLTSFANARPDAAKVVLPIVHMMPQSGKSGIVDAANRLKADCVTIIGSGIRSSREDMNNGTQANSVDRVIMEQVVTQPADRFYFEVDDFTALENAAPFVPKASTCPTPTPST